MKSVDGYLSELIQEVWPEAVVGVSDDDWWIVERGGLGPVVKLGAHFRDAKRAVQAIVGAEKSRDEADARGAGGPGGLRPPHPPGR